MIVSLPMYDLPEIRPATEAWWRGLAAWLCRFGMTEVPDRLESPADHYDHWRRPDLFLSQTCGYPLTHDLKGQVCLVATPCYRAEGCLGATYRSVILSHDASGIEKLDGLAGKRAAVNGYNSQSGWNILRHTLKDFGDIHGFLGETVITGGHRASIAALRARRADVAAVDCVTFELLRRHAPGEVADLAILAWSDSAPALPYITRAGIDAQSLARLRDGLQAAINDPELASARDALLLDGFSVLPIDEYDVILEQEAASDCTAIA